MVVILRHHELLNRLGLSTLAGARLFRGQRVKDHKGRRDILRIPPNPGDSGGPVLFLKRTWKPYKKDGLASLFRHGAVWSAARQEFENSKVLGAAGVTTAAVVAYGEECGPLWEHFSFLVTEAAAGTQTVLQFLAECADQSERRRVFGALALEIRRMHEAGLATPDLFTRHVFVDATVDPPRFCWIDMGRLEQRRPLPGRRRARDLAALNITAPLRFVSAGERVRFLRTYAGAVERRLAGQVSRRVAYLLRRRKFRDFRAGFPGPT